MKHSIDCVGFKLFRKGTLIGFADIGIPELRLKIHGARPAGPSHQTDRVAEPVRQNGNTFRTVSMNFCTPSRDISEVPSVFWLAGRSATL